MPVCKAVIRKALAINYIDFSPVSIQGVYDNDTPEHSEGGRTRADHSVLRFFIGLPARALKVRRPITAKAMAKISSSVRKKVPALTEMR